MFQDLQAFLLILKHPEILSTLISRISDLEFTRNAWGEKRFQIIE